ncbi:MAG: pyridoxal phosphate-dependent aminotransferase [Hyphomicrobiales bacterium]
MTAFQPDHHLSRRTAAVEEAAILRMAQRTRDLRAQGHDVVNLTVGEPDFDTPDHIRQAANAAIEAGYTHYPPVAGFPEVRQAIADKLRSENGLDYAAGEIAISNGAKQAITNAAFALLDPGDEVIFLAPYWVAYEGIVRMAGAMPVVLQSGIEDGFKVPVARLAEVLSERSKLLFLNSPCNPSGAVWSRADLEALAEAVRRHPQLFVIADEIYEYIVFDGEPVSFASLPGMKARTVTINGFSKAFAMTGWRLGYGAAPEPVARAMSKVQGTFTAGANAFVQQAGIAALKGGRGEVETMRATYLRRRDEVVRRLGAMAKVRFAVPAGTFYVFPDVSAFLGRSAGNHRVDTVDELCDWLLAEHLVATVPGSAFGNDRCIRLSFAASDAELARGLDRLGTALGSLET